MLKLIAMGSLALAYATDSLRSSRFLEEDRSQKVLGAADETAVSASSLEMSISGCKKRPLSPSAFNKGWDNRDFTLALVGGKATIGWTTGKGAAKSVTALSAPNADECGRFCEGTPNCMCLEVNEDPSRPARSESMYVACPSPQKVASFAATTSLLLALSSKGWQSYAQFLSAFPNAASITTESARVPVADLGEAGWRSGPIVTGAASAKKNPAAGAFCTSTLGGLKQFNFDGVLSAIGLLAMMKTGAKELAAGDADSAFPHNDFRLEIAKQLITSRLEAGSKDQTAVVELFAALQAAERPANSVLCAKLATMFWAAGAPFELNLSSPQKTAAATACTAGPSGSPDLAKLNAILAATTWHSSNGWLHQKIAPVTDFTIAEVTNNCGEYLNLAA